MFLLIFSLKKPLTEILYLIHCNAMSFLFLTKNLFDFLTNCFSSTFIPYFSQQRCILIFSEVNSCWTHWLKYRELHFSFKLPTNKQYIFCRDLHVNSRLQPLLVCRSNNLPLFDEKLKLKSSSTHKYIHPCSSLFFHYFYVVILRWLQVMCNGLFVAHSFARRPGSGKRLSTLRTKMDDANRRMFFFFPHCQHVLSWIWGGFPHLGIQRCATLLIRLLCHVPLHLSWAYCSRQREEETDRERM